MANETEIGDQQPMNDKAENNNVEPMCDVKDPPPTIDNISSQEDAKDEMSEDVTNDQSTASTGELASGTSEPVTVDFKVIYNKQKYDVTFPLNGTVESLKSHLHTLIDVPPAMQKIMYKGLAKNEKTLNDLKITKGAKVMVVGTTINDLLTVTSTKAGDVAKETAAGATASKELLCKQKQHKKVIDKGKPDDVMPGVKNAQERLPIRPLSGMINKSGGKVRLTFKMESDQLWLGTKERTEKIPMGSIKGVVSEAIEGHEDYHIMAIQLGPTEASRYWIYWVPAQYVDAIKDTILGKWQY